MTPGAAVTQINQLLPWLVRKGTVVDQRFAYQRKTIDGLWEVTFPNSDGLPLSLLRFSYNQGYEAMLRQRAYNILLANGAFVQMGYLFDGQKLLRHRLAYFGSPHPSEADNPDFLFPDGNSRHVPEQPATILRFDFNDFVHPPKANHPRSHMTIGHVAQCRIPVSSPVTPDQFLKFVLEHFHGIIDPMLPRFRAQFPLSISGEEYQRIHVSIPRTTQSTV